MTSDTIGLIITGVAALVGIGTLIIKINQPTRLKLKELDASHTRLMVGHDKLKELERRQNRISAAHTAHVKEVAGHYAKRKEVTIQIASLSDNINHRFDGLTDLIKALK